MADSRDTSEDTPLGVRRSGLLLGPALALGMVLSGPRAGLSAEAWAAAAVGTLMAVWWMTEALPLAATALVPLVLCPLLKVSSLEAAAQAYAHPLIFLFLGGFLLARAMERWQLHRRLATMAARAGGRSPRSLIFSVMAATAFLSMWVSNTATAMIMVPIGQSLIDTMRGRGGDRQEAAIDAFGASLMLGVAFAATIGGMGTLIGTPPNALFASTMQGTYGISIGFAQWMLVGVPVVLVLLPLAWLVLTRIALRVPNGDDLEVATPDLGVLPPMSREEKLIAVILGLTALGWVFRPLVSAAFPALAISDAGIAMTAALLLFALPARWSEGVFLLEWKDAQQIRWDVLILFGGGLALAEAMHSTGLAAWIGGAVTGLGHLPTPLLVLILMPIIVYLGELASNTAIAAVFLPVAGAAALGMAGAPATLMLPVALAASLGFMLPVATPPNAIAYGSGLVSAQQMLRAGALLDVIGVLVVAAVAMVLGPLIF
jgi:sodium-dependent dicarboxylate transporter 2/3/5